MKIFKKESPLEILDRRYANGEISTEEYEEKNKLLTKKKEDGLLF